MKAWTLSALLAGGLLLFSSCEELLFEPVPDTSPHSIFDQAWTFVDEEYSFFAYKSVDWDTARETYGSRITSEMDDTVLFDVIADMLYELRDGHVNLISEFNRSRNWRWYLDYPENYDYSVLERNYFLDTDGRSAHEYVGQAFVLMDFPHPDGNVGYIHYRSFASPVSPEDMDRVINRFADHKGLIIDVRGNGGGSISNVYTIANRLTDKTVAFAHEYSKTGPDHEAFGPPRTLSLTPVEDHTVFTRPVVVLTNRSSYSATNYFVTAVRELEHVVTMGDRTGGGGGLPAQTNLTNGWGIRVSTTRLYMLDPGGTLSMDERNVENGVDPDFPESSPESRLAIGIDDILEAALSYIRGL